MKYMLDTNIVIFVIKKRSADIIKRFLEHEPEDICISSITYAELLHGVENSNAREKNKLALTMFLSGIQIVPFDMAAAEAYGRIRADLQKKGTPIGPMDTLIAAHAKSLGLIVVTNNTREFSRVQDLDLEDWTMNAL